MNRALLLCLTLVVLLFALLGTWFVVHREGTQGSGSLGPAERSDAIAGSALSGDDGLPAAARAGAAQQVAEPAGLFLEGRVETTPGAPADERLEVVLLTRSTSYGSFALRDDARGHDAQRRAEFEEVRVSREPVGADGAFRLAWPDDADELHVMVRGRYHYMPESRAVARANLADALHLYPELGARIVGRVVDAAGGPVDMREHELVARPTVGLESADRRLRTRSSVVGDERGAFEMRALPVVQPYLLRTEPPGHAPGEMTVAGLAPGERREVVLALARGGTVRGFVVDGGGRTLEGARVEALVRGRVMGFDDRAVRDAVSGARGAFELLGTPVGECLVRARMDGYLDSEKLTLDVPDGGVVEGVVVTLSDGASLSGRVTWADGAPVAGARVLVGMQPSALQGPAALGARRGGKGSARTAQDGRFEVTGLGPGPFLVTCAAAPPGADPEDAGLCHRAARKGVTPAGGELALVLQAPFAIAGHVTDPLGQPIPSFHVEAVPADMGALELLLSRDGDVDFDSADNVFGLQPVSGAKADVEDDGGAFLLSGLQPGAWNVRASAAGWVMPEPLAVTLVAASARPEVTLVLQPTAAVSGVVLDPDRKPVAGARVRGTGNVMDELDDSAPHAVSDREGRFRIAGLEPGPSNLYATCEGFARTSSAALELPAGGELEGVEVVLSRGGTIMGEVYDADGEAARHESVAATHMALLRTVNTLSDGGGRFVLEHVEPGAWQLVAMNTGASRDGGDTDVGDLLGSMRMGSCEVVDGETTHVVLGAPPKDPVRVAGRVTHAGEPAAGALLSFYPEGEQPFERLELTSVADDGAYEVTLDGGGAYVISVQRVGAGLGQQQTIEFSRDVPADVERHRIDLELPVGRISGRVFGPDGEPAPSARVSLAREGGARSDTIMGGLSAELQTDGEGRYDIDFLRAGSYRVSAGGAPLIDLGADAGGLGRVTRAGLVLAEGEWLKDVDLHLPRPGSLSIRVRDAEGAPAEGVSVFVRDARGYAVEALSFRATGPGGTCAYPGLAPGDYTVFARRGASCTRESDAVAVQEGAATTVELALELGVVVRVQLLDKATGEATRASVTVLDEAQREVSGIYGLQDLQALYSGGSFSPTEYRVGPLPPGRYRVRATTPEGLDATKVVDLQAGSGERKIALRLKD